MTAIAKFTGLTVPDKVVKAELRRLERRTTKLVDNFEGWLPDWLSYKPSPESWSVPQVLDHLVRSEKFFREEAEKAFTQAASRPSFRER